MKPAALLALSLALFALLAPPRAAAQEAQPDEVIKVNTDLVVLDAQVISKKKQQAVGALRREDFELYEDGARREIGYFSRDELPLSVMLLLDVSGSVRPIIERVGEGAQDAMQRLRPGDEVAVMAFATNSKLIQGFTRDRQLVADKIREASREYSVGRGTMLTEALYEAARQMPGATNPASRRVVIVVTDNVAVLGGDNAVRRTMGELLESGAVVYGLVVRAAIGKVFNVLTLGKMNPVEHFSEQTGGEVLGADKKEVDEKLGDMFARLRSRYSLGFKPADTNEDGRLRRLKLQLTPEAVKRNGKVIVVTRQGYYFKRGATKPATYPASDGSARPRRIGTGAPPPRR
ncbi:MAG TPA: VWA domain-containing protein [Pyrinomonadaceae bacterium]|jgi:VWFA-related protein